jgi:integrase
LHGLTKPISDARAKTGASAEKLTDSAVYNYHKCLKAILYRAYKFGKINENPYNRLRGEFRHGDKENVEFLTEDEMKRIETLKLPTGSILDVVRDLFVFQMYTGLAYSDMQAFDFSLCKLVDGEYVYNGERIKTGVQYTSQLLPPVIRVLKKYGMKVPKVSNQDYNRHLKSIGLLAEIHTRMHTHLARHTFATYMLSNDVMLQNVKRMLGHKSIVTTQRYAKVLAKDVHNDFDKISEKLKHNEP